MTVGELKRILRDVPNDAEVVISLPEQLSHPGDYMAYASKAQFVAEGPINNDEFDIEAGETYSY